MYLFVCLFSTLLPYYFKNSLQNTEIRVTPNINLSSKLVPSKKKQFLKQSWEMPPKKGHFSNTMSEKYFCPLLRKILQFKRLNCSKDGAKTSFNFFVVLRHSYFDSQTSSNISFKGFLTSCQKILEKVFLKSKVGFPKNSNFC